MSNNIAAVAARIHERALQLSTEHVALAATQIELEQTKEGLSAETRENAYLRREMLTIARSRDGMELECLQLEEDVVTLEKKRSAVDQELRDIEQSHEEIKNRWEQVEKIYYSKHEMNLELFKREVEGKRTRHEAKKKKRRDDVNSLHKTAMRANEEAQSMHRERAEVRNDIRDMDECEEREIDEISATAMQIRATLAKRASLRPALRETQKKHTEVNASMLRWEKECVELSSTF